MASKLNYDCLQYIFEYCHDQNTLFKCLLVNRLWCESAVSHLWKDPFSISHHQRKNPRKLLTTIISMSPFDKNTEEKLKSYEYELIHLNYKRPFYDYLTFCRIFKYSEFHGFVDKCARAVTSKDEGRVSSILLYSVYEIFFKHCTEIRQIRLSPLPRMITKNCSFNNLSNLCELEISNFVAVQCFERLARGCRKIKKIKLVVSAFRKSQELVNLFKVQRKLKVVHCLNALKQCHIISEELSTQAHSIEELSMRNLMYSPYKQIDTFTKLKRLELSLTHWSPQAIAAFQNVSCPLLEVLKFLHELPPLDILAEFIEKTEGHLQCFYMEPYPFHPFRTFRQNSNTQVLIRSIAKSCPKIKSLAAFINVTEDKSAFECLLLSCNQLEHLSLTNVEEINNDDNEMIKQSLGKQLCVLRINENWNVRYEKNRFCGYRFIVEKA